MSEVTKVNFNKDNPEYLYRFRSLERILKDGELEKQEIHFAHPSKLNDPVEGYFDIFWSGDEIVWKNLLKHYLLCLERVHLLMRLGAEEITEKDIQVHLTTEKLETDHYRERFEKIFEEFFTARRGAKIYQTYANVKRKVRRGELIFLLRSVHMKALASISIVDGLSFSEPHNADEYFDKLLNLNSKECTEEPSMIDLGFKVAKMFMDQFDVIGAYQNEDYLANKNKRFILSEFPQKYVEQLEKLMYPPCYIACFTGKVDNAAIWGHYGSAHEGVCLKFRAGHSSDNLLGLNLKTITSYGSTRGEKEIRKGWSVKRFPFYKVNYEKKYPEIDFFRSIGRATVNDLTSFWYVGQDGSKSVCYSDVFKNENEWRNEYWKPFYDGKAIKLEEWKYEAEYRLLLSSNLSDLNDDQDRALKYDFKDLAGIIFGIRTPLKDKVEILKIVSKKCDEFKCYDIKFYQAEYSHSDGKMAIYELSSIKFKPDEKK